MTIVELSRLLASQKITSRQLVEQSLAAIKDPQGEGARAFLLVHDREALAAADRVDAQRRGGSKLPALAGIPCSTKPVLTSAEAFSWHRQWMKDRADKYDPRVIVRIRPGETMTAANYIELLQ